jgi:hypothetical protein
MHVNARNHVEGAMSTYEGKRTIDGLVVTVDGGRLDERYDVKRFTKYGFEWTYEGASPQQLALAVLVHHLGDSARALILSEPFMKSVIANLDNDWTLHSSDIDAFLRGVSGRRQQVVCGGTADHYFT